MEEEKTFTIDDAIERIEAIMSVCTTCTRPVTIPGGCIRCFCEKIILEEIRRLRNELIA